MRHRQIGAVMTREVVWATRETPLTEVAELLARNRISGLPVVDRDEKALGVVSESDLVRYQARCLGLRGCRWGGMAKLTRSWRGAEPMARAATAGRLMSQPAVTITSIPRSGP